ncbi:helix-turn-helix transcriptional regulator [Olleya namhaensis]|uniref:DNA-binding transcriptional regulator, XRE-family HTH domain n=1 Tax=Olleya namhaensis TaxID=1144750 RepID=A0A1I3JAF8_9FLAO|nr:helix-turn-helix transcriptional regulator [Olleya namhaensis]SFI57244.1 DNA-binding transcriptional regulator, XRE-family HTH domain [Olleya namhaensis]
MNTVIGERIRSLRLGKGKTQEDLAEVLKISQSAYARIESGNSNSWATHLLAISQFFEIKPEDITKQDHIKVDTINTNNGALYNSGTINQLSEKLIEQFEIRLQEQSILINELKAKIGQLES